MAVKKTSVLVFDKKESLPMRVNHATRKWEIFNPTTNSYNETGLSAVPEDDSTAIKYYKLSNTPTAPTAVGDSQTSWADIASLNTAVITQGGWSADPLSVSKEQRFCWAAYYSLENIFDQATKSYKQRYRLNMVGLYNNFADSPTISIGADGTITITNPDGTTETQQLMTHSSYTSLMAMVQGLQSQVDSAIYSYSGAGVPTTDHAKSPLNTWGIKAAGPDNVVADIYNAHVGDTYTDTDTYASYRFVVRDGGSTSNPSDYKWQPIADGALSSALAEISRLGDSSVKIFTEQPTAPYKKGDMWITTEGVTKQCIVSKDENGSFAGTDWIVPFAKKEDVEALQKGLATAKSQLNTATTNLEGLQGKFTKLETETLQAMEDSLIDDNERKSLKVLSGRLDVEQEQLLSNVEYLKNNAYLPEANKTELNNKANDLLEVTTGKIDVLQVKISAILDSAGDGGSKITNAERTAYDTALASYKLAHKVLSQAIDAAKAKIDEEMARQTNEKIDNIEIGGRNLLLDSDRIIAKYVADSISFVNQEDGILKISAEAGNNHWAALVCPQPTIDHLINNILDEEYITVTVWAKRLSGTGIPSLCLSHRMGYMALNGELNAEEYLPIVQTRKWRADTGKFVLQFGFKDCQGVFLFKCAKIEKGNKSTYWTPAPENMQGEDALLISINTQGHFRNSWEMNEQGEHVLVKEVVGGVVYNGVEYVECELLVRKGSADVTDSALADNSAAFKWYVNGVQRAGSQKILRLGISDANGEDDTIEIKYDDTNAKDWK